LVQFDENDVAHVSEVHAETALAGASNAVVGDQDAGTVRSCICVHGHDDRPESTEVMPQSTSVMR
jgi:hypothetical protein